MITFLILAIQLKVVFIAYIISTVINFVCSKSLRFLVVVTITHRSSCSEMLCNKGVVKNYLKLTGKQLCRGLIFNKFVDLRPATFSKERKWRRCFSVKERLRHKCFPMNFAKFCLLLDSEHFVGWSSLPNDIVVNYLRNLSKFSSDI